MFVRRSCSHSLPRLWNTATSPLGETVTQRSILVVKVLGWTSTGKRSASITVRVSFTWKGIGVAWWLATSTRWSLPPAHSTISLPSGVQATEGYTPWIAQVSCMSRSSPVNTACSAPDSSSRTNSTVRRPWRRT